MTVLATVRHTGSHTAQNIFCSHVLHYLAEDPHGEPQLWFGHCEPGTRAQLRLRYEESPPLVLVMRHPMAVWGSWRRRNKPADNTFCDSWQMLFRLKDEAEDSYWLPMDTPDRLEYLEAIEDRLCMPLNHDWTPRGVFSTERVDCEGGMSDQEAYQFFATLPFEQFGYEL